MPQGSSTTVKPFPFSQQNLSNVSSELGLHPDTFVAFTDLAYQLMHLLEQAQAYTVFFPTAVENNGVTVHLPGGLLIHTNPTQSSPLSLPQPEEELQAAKSGIVYHTLSGAGRIGTLVNGAGLAMNTVDFLKLRGGSVANFLDTGGKATGRTVVEGFRIVLADKRVKTIFVNIFGGLTDCAMIAEGILMAYKELGMEGKGVPLVVRLRGTNEEIGQELVSNPSPTLGRRLIAADSEQWSAGVGV
jgi:succinyl-CoA synthetase alpha subunit